MNPWLTYWPHIIAFALSVLLAVVFMFQVQKKAQAQLRPLVAVLLFFAPAAIFIQLLFHTAKIAYTVATAAAASGFVYDFRFYGLQLTGILLLHLSIRLWVDCRLVCLHRCFIKKRLFKTIFQLIVVSLPAIAFTPLGALPAAVCTVSLAALPFLKKKPLKDGTSKKEEAILWQAEGI